MQGAAPKSESQFYHFFTIFEGENLRKPEKK